MTDEELAEYERRNSSLWNQSGQDNDRYVTVRSLIAEVRRLKAENENLAGELRDEKAYAKELRDNMGQAGIY